MDISINLKIASAVLYFNKGYHYFWSMLGKFCKLRPKKFTFPPNDSKIQGNTTHIDHAVGMVCRFDYVTDDRSNFNLSY